MNLLRQYLRTTSFAYSIIRNGQIIEKDRDNLLAGTFNAKKNSPSPAGKDDSLLFTNLRDKILSPLLLDITITTT